MTELSIGDGSSLYYAYHEFLIDYSYGNGRGYNQ